MDQREEKVRWGVLGTATIAWNHTLPGMLEAENCELVAIAGRNPEKTEQFRERFGFQKAYLSYDELLDDPEIEAVYIPLPNQLHKEWTIRAARKKKHVLCEKPLAPTAAEVREVVEVCRQEGVLLMEAFAYLHSPVLRSAIRDVHAGAVGKPLFIETVFMVRPWDTDNIRMRKETMGGCTYDQGCYNLSLILRLLGEMPDEISVNAHYMENDVDDFSCVFLHFPSGACAYAVSALCSGQRADRFFVHGSEGTMDAPLPYNAKGLLTYTVRRQGTAVTTTVETPSNYRLEAEQFSRCIRHGEAPLVGNDFSLRVAEVLTQVLTKMGYFGS